MSGKQSKKKTPKKSLRGTSKKISKKMPKKKTARAPKKASSLTRAAKRPKRTLSGKTRTPKRKKAPATKSVTTKVVRKIDLNRAVQHRPSPISTQSHEPQEQNPIRPIERPPSEQEETPSASTGRPRTQYSVPFSYRKPTVIRGTTIRPGSIIYTLSVPADCKETIEFPMHAANTNKLPRFVPHTVIATNGVTIAFSKAKNGSYLWVENTTDFSKWLLVTPKEVLAAREEIKRRFYNLAKEMVEVAVYEESQAKKIADNLREQMRKISRGDHIAFQNINEPVKFDK